NDTDPAPPSDWFFVNMPDANSSVSVSFESTAGGTYALAVTYTAEADQNLELYLNSALASSVTLEATEGEWESQNFTNLTFNAGANQIELRATGGGIGVDKVDFFTLVTGVLERPGLPEGFALSQNYPNPFNPMTNIEFDLGRMSNVSLTIYNILGQKVATLLNNVEMNAGRYTYQFDARNLATGVYFYSLEAGDFKTQKKMLLLK
ncbi:MAG: T9SS type A sorting domain-containing protein, partial [Ignavibacteriaceae bacterium]